MKTFGKVILGMAIAGVAAIVLLVFAARGLSKRIHVQESGAEGQKTVNVETPFGHVQVHENDRLDPERLGIPVYPGAVLSKDKGGANFQFDAGDLHKDFTATGALYYADDSVDQVREFYRKKFPSWKESWVNQEYRLESMGDGQLRSVAVKREKERTRIAVASVGPPAGN